MKGGHRTQADDPNASIRPILAAELSSAQAALESQIEQLRHAAIATGDSGSVANAESQLQRLALLGRKLDHASPEALRAMQAEVLAVIANAQQTAQQVSTATANARTAEVALHSAQAQARRVTDDFLHDFYERKIFDPYLTFSSPEEERAYREREEARQRAIEAARAQGTPQGELTALRLSQEQLEDAARFGADRSPEFAPTYNRVVQARGDLEQALGVSPEASQQASLQEPAVPPSLVCPDIIASLRNAGVSVPSDTAAPSSVPHRPLDHARSPA